MLGHLMWHRSGTAAHIIENATNAHAVTSAGQSAGVAAGSVVQIGALTIATYAVELLLERGFVFAVGTLLYQFLQGGSRPDADLLCHWWSSDVWMTLDASKTDGPCTFEPLSQGALPCPSA